MNDILKRWRVIPVIIYMICCILPSISRNIGVLPLLIVIILLFVSLIERIVRFDINMLGLIMVYWVYIIFEYLRVRNITSIGNLFDNMLFIVPIIYVLFNNKEDEVNNKIIVYSSIIIQTVVAYSNILLLIEKPYLSKYMTGGVGYVVDEYKNTNLGGVTNVFISVCISIVILIIIKSVNNKFLKVLLYVAFFINGSFIIIARSTICLCIFIIGIIWFPRVGKLHTKVFVTFLIVILGLLFFAFSKSISESIMNLDIPSEYKDRIIEIIDWITGESSIDTLGSINGRFVDYITSIKTFLTNPILGKGMIYSSDVSVVGMHSELVDFLARYGLVGIIILTLIIKKHMKIIKIDYKEDLKFFVGIILLYMVFNPVITRGTGIILFWIIPYVIKINIQRESRIDDIVCSE